MFIKPEFYKFKAFVEGSHGVSRTTVDVVLYSEYLKVRKELDILKNKLRNISENKPKYLYRPDDGQRFTLQKNDKYTMDSCVMYPKYEYSYEHLFYCGFVSDFDRCKIVKYVKPHKGCGYDDDEGC